MTKHPEHISQSNVANTLLRWLIWLCVPVVALALPLYPLVTPAYVHWQYSQPNFPPSERFSEAERIRLSDVIVNYLRGKASLEEMQEMRTDEGEIAMRPAEVQHIVDVKRVMDGFYTACPIALAVGVLASLILSRRETRQATARALRTGIGITLGLIVVVGVSAALNFETFFDRFHRIFFTGESWLFYYEDTLIQLYPLPFWIRAVWQMCAIIAAKLGLLLGASYLIGRKKTLPHPEDF